VTRAETTTSASASAHDRRQRRVLIGLALLFFAPLGLAFYLYYGHGAWHPGGRVNAGELIEPARPLPALALALQGTGNTAPDFLKGRWTLLQVGSGSCAEACRARLYDTRQVRLALDRDMKRVQRVFIADADCCEAEFLHEQHPDLIVIRAGESAAPLLALLPRKGDAATESTRRTAEGVPVDGARGAGEGVPADGARGAAKGSREAREAAGAADGPRVYLIDPLGNLMMFYAADVKSKGMLEDMKRLLRLSSVG
jgi:hypothetical protein